MKIIAPIIIALSLTLFSCNNNLKTEVKKAAKQTVKYSTEEFLNAALDGKIATVKEAVNSGISINVRDQDGKNALMMAAFNGHTQIVNELLDNGIEINEVDSLGRTALMYGATGAFSETIRVLLDHNADVNVIDNVEHFTALMFAASEGQLEVVKILVENGANVSLKDKDGDSAKDFAIQNKHNVVAEYLLSSHK